MNTVPVTVQLALALQLTLGASPAWLGGLRQGGGAMRAVLNVNSVCFSRTRVG